MYKRITAAFFAASILFTGVARADEETVVATMDRDSDPQRCFIVEGNVIQHIGGIGAKIASTKDTIYLRDRFMVVTVTYDPGDKINQLKNHLHVYGIDYDMCN